MTAIAATSPSDQTTGQSSQANNLGSQPLGENDFLNLMMDEMSNQDPLDPSSSDPTQYLGELAQFTSLEQQTNIAQADQQIATADQAGSAFAMLGHTVTYTDQNGNVQSGQVSSVQLTNQGPTLTVGSNSGVLLSSVTGVS
jgi:flagellar basal-body rod modification protein FlgD